MTVKVINVLITKTLNKEKIKFVSFTYQSKAFCDSRDYTAAIDSYSPSMIMGKSMNDSEFIQKLLI